MVDRITILLIILACLFFEKDISAQTDIQLTQYWAVPSYYNPAAAGATDYLRIRGGGRLQWIGIEHAPKSFLALADSPFRIGKHRLGGGVNVSQESIGLFSNLSINLQLNYKIKIGGGFLSAGIQGGMVNSKFKGSESYVPDSGESGVIADEGIPTRDISGKAFDLTAGLFYSHKYFSIGLSGAHLLNPVIKFGDEASEGQGEQQFETELSRRVNFIADGNIPLKNTLFELQPSMMMNTDFSSFSAELTLRARVRKFLSFGAGYRYKDAVSLMVGAEYKNFFLGYSYDYPISAISKVSSGSHEIIAGYSIKLDFSNKNRYRHRSIRIL